MEFKFLKSAGRLFHSCGATLHKALSSADVRFAAGTVAEIISFGRAFMLNLHIGRQFVFFTLELQSSKIVLICFLKDSRFESI